MAGTLTAISANAWAASALTLAQALDSLSLRLDDPITETILFVWKSCQDTLKRKALSRSHCWRCSALLPHPQDHPEPAQEQAWASPAHWAPGQRDTLILILPAPWPEVGKTWPGTESPTRESSPAQPAMFCARLHSRLSAEADVSNLSLKPNNLIHQICSSGGWGGGGGVHLKLIYKLDD